jgi:hypothetical protein
VFGNQKINVRPLDADKVEWFTRTMKPPAATTLLHREHTGTGGRASQACGVAIEEGRLRNRAPAAFCDRSIAGIPTAA